MEKQVSDGNIYLVVSAQIVTAAAACRLASSANGSSPNIAVL
jgi:hypothetical protein